MGGFVLQIVFVAGLLSLIVVVAGRMFRLSPAVRFGLWLVVLLKLLAPPVVEWPWDATRLFPEAMTQVWVAEGPLPRSSPSREAVVILAATASAMPTDGGLTAAPLGPGVPLTLGQFFLIAWLIGSLAVLFGHARCIFRFRHKLSASQPAPTRIVEITAGVARQLRMRPPPVRVVETVGGPVVWSFGRALPHNRDVIDLTPASLESGVWLQFVAAMAAESQFKTCEYCGNFYDASTTRKTKKYCGDSCKTRAWNKAHPDHVNNARKKKGVATDGTV